MSLLKKKKAMVQFSDSSASDADGDTEADLAKEMARTAQKLREKNPHAEQGRAAMPRSNPLERRPTVAVAASTTATAGARRRGEEAAGKQKNGPSPSVQQKTKKMDLFGDSDSSSDGESETVKHGTGSGAAHDGRQGAVTGNGKAKKKQLMSSSSDSDADDDGAEKAAERPSALYEKVKKSKKSSTECKKAEEEETGEGDENETAVDRISGLHINTKYAAKFEEVKRKQELQRLTEKYGKRLEGVKHMVKKSKAGNGSDADGEDEEDEFFDSDSDSNAEPEDDDAVLLTKESELAFAQALLAVRKAAAKEGTKGKSREHEKGGDHAVEEEDEESYLNKRYFPPVEEQIKRNTEVYEQAIKDKDKKKKFTLKDEFQRTVKITAEGEDDGNDDPDDNGSGLRKLKPQSAEERALRRAFLDSVADSTDAFSVTKKETAKGGERKEGASDSIGNSKEDEERQLEEQRRKLMEEAFSKGSKADEDEAFIRQFFMNDLWRGCGGAGSSSDDEDDDDHHGTEHGGKNYAKTLAELAQAEEDEAFYNDADAWEREYQEKKYRHEEEAEAAQIQTFPRPIGDAAAGLLRKTSDARKDARRRKKERLEAARLQQVEELKRLKHLKRQEIEEQRALIAAVAGIADSKKEQQRREENKPKTGDDGKPTWSDDDGDEDAALEKLKAVWSDKDLNAPFDPEEFDKKMALLFNDEYYAPENVNEDEIAYMEAELDNTDADSGNEDDEEEEEGEEEGASDSDKEGNDGESDKRKANGAVGKRTASRAKFAALAEEPDLFKASSLEEAKKLQLAAAASKKKPKDDAKAGGMDRRDEDADLFFSDPFGPSSTVGTDLTPSPSAETTSKRALAGRDRAKEEAADDLALLYPSASLSHLQSAASHETPLSMNSLLDEHRNVNSGKANDAANNNAGENASDGDEEETEEAVLKRLQADLKRKEEEYYALHHDGALTGTSAKTRFRYREVEPEDFTLSIEEILARDDRQLNMIAPMNCYAAYLDKSANQRDRVRIERRRLKGFRETETERTSRRYGDVGKTILLNPEQMTEEEGLEVAQRLRKRLRDEGVDDARREEVSGKGEKGHRPNAPSRPGSAHQNSSARGREGPSFRGRGGFEGSHRPPFHRGNSQSGSNHFRGRGFGARGGSFAGGRGRGGAPFVPRGGRSGSRGH